VSGSEWFLLIVVVIGIPLLIAVAVTLWTLEMARLRNKKNRHQPPTPVKRKATRETTPKDEGVSRET
jgi:cytochrome c biogenesis protein ResB